MGFPPVSQTVQLGGQNGAFDVPAPQFTRLANATPYVSGYLVANDTTAANVVPLAFANLMLGPGNSIGITTAKLFKSTASLTNAAFYLHLFNQLPVVSVGDGAAFDTAGALAVGTVAGYLGYISITMDTSGTAGGSGRGVPTNPSVNMLVCQPNPANGGTLWGLLEARGAYTPGSQETFLAAIQGVR